MNLKMSILILTRRRETQRDREGERDYFLGVCEQGLNENKRKTTLIANTFLVLPRVH